MVLDAILAREQRPSYADYGMALGQAGRSSVIPQLWSQHGQTMSDMTLRQADREQRMLDSFLDRGLSAWQAQQQMDLTRKQMEQAQKQFESQHALQREAADLARQQWELEKQYKPRQLEAQIGQMESARRMAELQMQQQQREFEESQRLAKDLGFADALPTETIEQYKTRMGLRGALADTRLRELQAEYMPKEFDLKRRELEQQRQLQAANLALQRQQLAMQQQQMQFAQQQQLSQQAQQELSTFATGVLSGTIQPPKGVAPHEYVMHVAQQRAKQLGLSNFDSMLMTSMALKQAGDEVGAKKAQAQMLAMSNPLEQAKLASAVKAFNTATEGAELLNRLSGAAARYTKATRFYNNNEATDAANEIRLLLGKLAQSNPELAVFAKRFEDIDAGVWGGSQKLANLFGAAPHIQLQQLIKDLSNQIKGIVESAPKTEFSTPHLMQANQILEQSIIRFNDAALGGTRPDNIFSQQMRMTGGR